MSAASTTPTTGSSKRGDPNREAIIRHALGVEGPITTVVYQDVEKAVQDGRLHARLPDKVTFYRWLRPVHPSARGNTRSANAGAAAVRAAMSPAGDTDRCTTTPGTTLVTAPLDAGGTDTPPRTATGYRPQIELAEARLNVLRARLIDIKQFDAHHRRHLKLLKALGRAHDGVWSVRRTGRLLADADAQIASYARILAAADADIGGVAPSTPTEPVRTPQREQPAQSRPASAVGSGADTDVAAWPVDIYHDPLEPAVPPEEQWGVLMGQEPRSAYGAIVGHTKPKHNRRKAWVRAQLLAPVRNGQMNAEACAGMWRAEFAGRGTPESALLAKGLTADERIEWQELTARTLQRWGKAVRDEETEARAAGDETGVNVTSVLTHRQPEHRRPRKATPAVRELAAKIYEEQPELSKAQVAAHLRDARGIDISDRTVQQILADELSDEARADARGGPAAHEVTFRRRLLREARYPNRCWIMDHSFLRHEVHKPEHLGKCEDFDFQFAYIVYRGGVRRRVKGLFLTLIMDACTRRVLALRVWDKAPTTEETLLVLHEAMRRFGRPDILYTDNGADLASGAVRDALAGAEIHHVFSLPYTPEGRGKIERIFRTIKERLLAFIPGYYGGDLPAEWGEDDVLDLAEVEARIQDGVERLLNSAQHDSTKKIPTVHYDNVVGARRLRHVGPVSAAPEELLHLLLMRAEVLNRAEGFRFLGRRYYSLDLGHVPNGAQLYVYYDPRHLEVVHVCVAGPGGALTYLGPAEWYDADHPPPSKAAQDAAEAAWAKEQDQRLADGRAARAEARRIQAMRDAGEAQGSADADVTFAAGETDIIDAEIIDAEVVDEEALAPSPPAAALPSSGRAKRLTNGRDAGSAAAAGTTGPNAPNGQSSTGLIAVQARGARRRPSTNASALAAPWD